VYPIDVSHKRQTRTRAAMAARMVLEASYRDAVRLTIDQLYQAYVDALTAQIVIDVRATKQHDVWANIEVDEPRSALEQARRSLGFLIEAPLAEIESRKLSGRLQFEPADEARLYDAELLVRLALLNRPDLHAQRLAVSFAEANINAVLASRFDDVLLLYQPYTFHDGRQGTGSPNSLSWTLGVTVPLPIYNRQQGNLLKARQAADQARTRLALVEKTVASEVEAAVLEHKTAHQALTRTWTDFSNFNWPPLLTRETMREVMWPRVERVDNFQVPPKGINQIVFGKDDQGLLHVRFFDIAGNFKDAVETKRSGPPRGPFAILHVLYEELASLEKKKSEEKDRDAREKISEQIDLDHSKVITEVILLVGTPEQKLNDRLRQRLTATDDRVTALLKDQISDKLKTYWETLIRHRKSMLKLNTVTGVCVSP
jgi:hypothetical protein